MKTTIHQIGPQYVNANRLLEVLFDEDSRPTLRTLRTWTAEGMIPYVRLGGLVFFDPQAVRATLECNRTVRAGRRR